MTQRVKVETKDTFNNGTKSSREIEQEIGQTREAISDDIRALGDKVSPANIKAEAKVALTEAKDAAIGKAVEVKDAAVESVVAATSVAVDKAVEVKDVVVDKAIEVKDVVMDKAIEMKDAAAVKVDEYKEIASDTYDEVSYQARRASVATWSYTKANAVPLALIGVGAGLLFANSRRGRDEHASRPVMRRTTPYRGELYDDRSETGYAAQSATPRVTTPSATQKIAAAGSRVSESARGLYQGAGERLQKAEHRIADSAVRSRDYAKEKLVRARDATRDFAEENPLPVALATVALGIGVGLLLPSTNRENELLAPTREKLGRFVDEARDAAYDAVSVAKETAKETVHTTMG